MGIIKTGEFRVNIRKNLPTDIKSRMGHFGGRRIFFKILSLRDIVEENFFFSNGLNLMTPVVSNLKFGNLLTLMLYCGMEVTHGSYGLGQGTHREVFRL